jgi:hypothetical protein
LNNDDESDHDNHGGIVNDNAVNEIEASSGAPPNQSAVNKKHPQQLLLTQRLIKNISFQKQ